MNKERIEELFDSVWVLAEREDALKAFITAINETKEEDAALCEEFQGKKVSFYVRKAILASKIKE